MAWCGMVWDGMGCGFSSGMRGVWSDVHVMDFIAMNAERACGRELKQRRALMVIFCSAPCRRKAMLNSCLMSFFLLGIPRASRKIISSKARSSSKHALVLGNSRVSES